MKKRIIKKKRSYTRIVKGRRKRVRPHKQSYIRGIPKKLKKVKVWKTKFIQEKKTGLMKGRKRVKAGPGDKTAILYDPKTGRIFGRIPRKSLSSWNIEIEPSDDISEKTFEATKALTLGKRKVPIRRKKQLKESTLEIYPGEEITIKQR